MNKRTTFKGYCGVSLPITFIPSFSSESTIINFLHSPFCHRSVGPLPCCYNSSDMVHCSACKREFAAVFEPSQVWHWVADGAHSEADALELLGLHRCQLLHEPRWLLSLAGPHCQVTLDGQIKSGRLVNRYSQVKWTHVDNVLELFCVGFTVHTKSQRPISIVA